ncbi:MAG: SixA phosphatase family protein [Myxococcota bacterium]
MRHGIAEDVAESDFDRALTPEGTQQLERLLDEIVRTGWSPGSILHSPYLRTTQTAEAVQARYPAVPRHAVDDIALGSMDAILRAASRFPDPLIVGHEPTLGNLCARLLGAPTGAVRFDRAGFAVLDVDRIPTTRPARLVVFLAPQWVVRG